MTQPFLPTDSELEILKVLWEKQPCSVRDVHDAIVRDGRPLAYTTVLKLMQIMTEKQLVKRDSSNRAHVYCAAIPRPQTQKQLVDDLLDRAFSGAASELVLHALSGRKSTPEELAEIRCLLEKLEKSTESKSNKSPG
ncbi:MAG: BlaI/MecI/CopY family transcriptional regulator [Pirellula sp.]